MLNPENRHVDDLLDAYALGALEPYEVAEVEAHLDGCASCRQSAARARATARQLLLASPPIMPPAALRAKVLARVHAVAAQERAITDAVAPREVATPAALPAGGSRRRNLLRRLLDTVLSDAPLSADDPVAALLIQLLSQPTCEVWNVGGTKDAPKANARLVGVPNGRDGVLVTNGLGALNADQTYQVWLLHDGKPVPNALFSVERGGRGRQIVHAPTRFSDFEVVAVTPEPANGSAAPTGPIVLMGTLTAA